MQETSFGGAVLLSSRVEIFPSTPLPDLNSVGGPAFAAQTKGDASAALMSVLCNSGLPTRLDVVTSMRSLDHPCLLRLIDSGVVLWPGDNTHYMSYAFQRPLAPRLATTVDDLFAPMSEDAFNHYFITPMIGALVELERSGVVHNAIRTTNIFWRTGSATPPQIGECLSSPAGYGQPVIFEPIERAMCQPLGRGPGSHVDDCYAFGVVLAMLILGGNPFKGMSDDDVIRLKLERGSFGAIIGNHRIVPSHIEILRGLLTDDGRQRWTATDLEQWLGGRRLTPKNTDAGRRAARYLDFAGKQYFQTRPLAHAFAKNVADAAKVIESGTLDKWLRRALGDDEKAADVESAVETLKASGKTANFEEQLVARTCIALDPPSPIRYRGISVMPAGIATMMIESMLTGANQQTLSEIISSQLVTLWVELQKDAKKDLVPIGQQFERMRNLIDKTSYGNGLERVVYELNPGLPCLSPFLRAQYITAPKALLPALERVANSGNRPREPMDRHLAAFLVVRDRRSEILFNVIGTADDPIRRGLALLTLYSEMQYRYGPDSVPGVSQWIAPLVEPSVNRFLGKVLREKTQKELRDIITRGDLNSMVRLVDDPKRLERNQQDFMAARLLYLNTLKEIASLENKLNHKEKLIQATGKPMAATLSSMLAIVLVIVIIMRAVWHSFVI